MKKKITKLPEAELDIMMMLWKKGKEPSRISEIHEGLKDIRPCTKPALHRLLDRLSEKGFVRVDTVQDTVSYKLFYPEVTEEEYRMVESKHFINKLCRGRWQNLIASLVESENLSRSDIDELTEILNGKKEDKK